MSLIEQFKKSEQGAVYQALVICDFGKDERHIYEDDLLFSTFENALKGAFYGKSITRERINSGDKSVDFRIRKKYLDNQNYISAKVSPTGDVIKLWDCRDCQGEDNIYE